MILSRLLVLAHLAILAPTHVSAIGTSNKQDELVKLDNLEAELEFHESGDSSFDVSVPDSGHERRLDRRAVLTSISNLRPSGGSSNLGTSVNFRVDVSNIFGINSVFLFVKSQNQAQYDVYRMVNSGNTWSGQVSLPNDATYQWFVKSRNRFNGVKDSDVLSFTVGATGQASEPTPVATTPAPPAPVPLVNNIQASCFTVDTSRFNICLDLKLSNNNRIEAFQRAKDTWESVITEQSQIVQQFGPFLKSKEKGVVWANDVPFTLDDIYIAAFEEPIDGPGRILGSAGPQFLNRDSLTVNGRMRFDSADVQQLLDQNPTFWLNVVTHEMAHVLGVGTLWKDKGLLVGSRYFGERAQAEWEALGCTDSLPVETDGGPGTAFGHWDEQCLDSELMTGFLNSGIGNNPLSRITIASLEDLGYGVTYTASESFSLRNINTNICCFPRRQLRRNRFDAEENLRRKARKLALSDRIVEIAARFAARELRNNRNNAPIDIPDNLRYVGGDIISVLVYDEDEIIRDMTFSWEEVEAFA